MTTATLTSKGQITIPAEIREALGVQAGDRVEFVEVAPGRYEFIAATKELVIERAKIVWKALRMFQTADADFADCIIERSAAAMGCEKTMSFDRGAAKGAGMTLVA